MTAPPEPPSSDPGEPRETEAQRRARVLAKLERSLAEGTPADEAGWQYPPAPLVEATLAPPLSWGILIHLGTVVAVVVIAFVAAVVEGATIPA